MNPKVSIIILNWNGWEDTIECLESLYQITYPNYEVIVVDNGSEDESIEKIREYAEGKIKVESKFFEYSGDNKPIKIIEYTREEAEAGGGKEQEIDDLPSNRKLILIKNEKNYGFAEGNNIGMRYALNLNPDYILLLNNDTVVDKEFLGELVKVGEGDEKIGVVGAVNYYYDDPRRIWYSGMDLIRSKLRLADIDITRNKIDNNQFARIREVDEIVGSCLMIKVEVINKIGMLYSNYFCHYEDNEWCIKAKKKGYFIYANLDSKIWHKVASSQKKISGFETYYTTRNCFIFMKRNATKPQFIYFLIHFFLVKIILTTGSLLVLHKDLKLLKTYYRAIYDGIRLSLLSLRDL